MRLDKFLTDNNIGTRSQVKGYIKNGRVCVNDEKITLPEHKIEENIDIVMVDGKQTAYEKYVYYMLHKPAGVVSATNDNTCNTVIDLLSKEGRDDLFPIGRLDKDTEGLLLITNDGQLSHQLLSPKKHVEKTYYAKINGFITEKHIEQFAKGLDIGENKLTLPANLVIVDREICETSLESTSEVTVTITEGKFHQIKRMFHAIGKEVVYLKRISIGGLALDESLQKGAYRCLTAEEIALLKHR